MYVINKVVIDNISDLVEDIDGIDKDKNAVYPVIAAPIGLRLPKDEDKYLILTDAGVFLTLHDSLDEAQMLVQQSSSKDLKVLSLRVYDKRIH